MSSEILSVLEYMEKEKGIPRADMISAIVNAIKTAALKGVNSGQELKIEISPKNGQLKAWALMKVVDSVSDPKKEIHVEKAQVFKHGAALGETGLKRRTRFGTLTLANPVMTASGCFGYGVEYAGQIDLRQIGGSEALFRRVLDLFVSRVPLAVDRIQSVTAACDRLEAAARQNGNFDAGALVAAIIAEVRTVLTRLEDLRAA